MAFLNIKKLQKGQKVSVLLKQKENIIYLTGQEFISGFLLVTPKTTVFFGDGLEFALGLKNDQLKNLSKYLRAESTLEVEDSFSVREHNLLKKIVPKVKLSFVSGTVDHLRAVKSKEELGFVRDAVLLTHAVFKEIKKALSSDQWTETQLARLIRYSGIGLGAQDVSFAPIVAAGPNSAIPHHKPTHRVIKNGEPVVLDFGFKVGQYCSDFTRTIFLKKAPRDFAEIYKTTLNAYEAAYGGVKAGIKGKELDGLARKVLDKQKLSKLFIHSLGHGTGLEVHERPGVGPFAEDVLQDGMVFSIEPGVYKKGKGGVRIEDLVYMENGKVKQFAEASRSLEDNTIK